MQKDSIKEMLTGFEKKKEPFGTKSAVKTKLDKDEKGR